MKAIILRGPDQYEYCNTDMPTIEEEGLLIKSLACGLCGSDLRTLSHGHMNIEYPWIIGHEVCGIVEKTGRNYKGPLKKGDKLAVAPPVYCGKCEFCKKGRFELCLNLKELAQHWAGGFAEYMAIPKAALDLGCIVKVEENMDIRVAAVSEPPSSCINAQEKLGVGLGDTVLIMGAGPIGCIHICVARARGARRIFIADVSQGRLDLCRQFGDVELVNARNTDVVEHILGLTGGAGVDVVITANSVGETQVQAIKVAKKGGRIAFFGGLPHGNSHPGIDTNLIHYKGLQVIGTTGFSPAHHLLSLEMIRSGKIPVDQLVTHVLPLEKFAEGVDLARSGKALKVVFTI